MSGPLLLIDPRMLAHRPPGGHPERPERLVAILQALKGAGYLFSCPAGTVREARDAELARVHDAEYLARIHQIEGSGGGQIEVDTWMSPGSELAARLACGAVVEAVAAVARGAAKTAFCAVRPPGHHARPRSAMGFCLYGNVAAAAAYAVEELGMSRVLVVDFDVHHGNGTQEMFYADPRVGFFSIHRYPFYPGTGAADETGTGPGLGCTRNEPIAFGTPPRVVHERFRAGLEALSDKMKPELVLVSAGFDAHRLDPVGDLGLDIEDFVVFTQALREVAEVHAGGRLVSVLEGGYNTEMLARCVEAHLEALGAERDLHH